MNSVISSHFQSFQSRSWKVAEHFLSALNHCRIRKEQVHFEEKSEWGHMLQVKTAQSLS
jgi:hypothetical protein